MKIVPAPGGFQIVPEAWAADQPARNTAAARSWAELADLCEAHAAWCAMVLETRQIDPHDRRMIEIEQGNMSGAVAAYRHWATLQRPFRGTATRAAP